MRKYKSRKMQWFAAGMVAVLLSGAFLIAAANTHRASAQAIINPADFRAQVDNPYFTLAPGATFDYKRSATDGSTETVKTIVTNQTREVMGVKTVVVWDRAWLDGKLIEDTYDWYAQDKEGNVWYFGEDTKQYKDGTVIGTKGSWEGGVNSAEPGIIMKARPKVGDSYRQEYSKGIAEDTAQVLALDQVVSTPYGSFTGCLQTLDTSTLEPALKENKYYCPRAGGNVTLVVDTVANDREGLVNVHTDADFASTGQALPPVTPAATPGMPSTGQPASHALETVVLAFCLVLSGLGLRSYLREEKGWR